MRLIDANTVELEATFTEPTKSTDGSVLDDLDYSTIHIVTPAGTIKLPVQESSAAGGQDLRANVQVNAPANTKTALKFYMTSTDIKGNEGPKGPELLYTVDRVAPEAPTSFTIA